MGVQPTQPVKQSSSSSTKPKLELCRGHFVVIQSSASVQNSAALLLLSVCLALVFVYRTTELQMNEEEEEDNLLLNVWKSISEIRMDGLQYNSERTYSSVWPHLQRTRRVSKVYSISILGVPSTKSLFSEPPTTALKENSAVLAEGHFDLRELRTFCVGNLQNVSLLVQTEKTVANR